MRMLAVFEKSERLRHIGHLDLMRSMQRALRRSGLPIAYSKGFNPHILVTFASALSVGAIGLREIMDVTLDEAEGEEVSPEAFLTAMNKALPPELQLVEARRLEQQHPALMATMYAANYAIRILDAAAAEKLRSALPAFLAQETIPAMRKTKSGMKECDIRPLIQTLAMDGDVLTATLVQSEGANCKPDMLLGALSGLAGIETPRCRITRTQLYGLDAEGKLQPLEVL